MTQMRDKYQVAASIVTDVDQRRVDEWSRFAKRFIVTFGYTQKKRYVLSEDARVGLVPSGSNPLISKTLRWYDGDIRGTLPTLPYREILLKRVVDDVPIFFSSRQIRDAIEVFQGDYVRFKFSLHQYDSRTCMGGPMKVINTRTNDEILITPFVHRDDHGEIHLNIEAHDPNWIIVDDEYRHDITDRTRVVYTDRYLYLRISDSNILRITKTTRKTVPRKDFDRAIRKATYVTSVLDDVCDESMLDLKLDLMRTPKRGVIYPDDMDRLRESVMNE